MHLVKYFYELHMINISSFLKQMFMAFKNPLINDMLYYWFIICIKALTEVVHHLLLILHSFCFLYFIIKHSTKKMFYDWLLCYHQ